MAEEGGLERLLGFCELYNWLASDSSDSRDGRNSVAVNERGQSKQGKQDLRSFEHERKRPKCPSRKAVTARKCRLKKKKFLEYLESDVARLSAENARLKQSLEGQSSLVCSLRKEVNYLKGVLANNKEISMLIKSIHNTGLPITSSLRKQSPSNRMQSTADHNFVCTRSDSSTATSCSGLFDKDSATLASDDKNQQVAIIDDVTPFLSMPPDDTLDLPLLSPSEMDPYDTEFSDCYSVQPSTFNSPVAGCAAGDELFMDAGVCLHVSKRRVSLEFCSICSSNALSTWEDMDAVN